mmetsp:Transcript_25878/g.56103  ORF Transcript_25878/g.56103 Transcript_25878/m.56103 type:complete len:286 (+) Transcript_25878:2303-3160(+)
MLESRAAIRPRMSLESDSSIVASVLCLLGDDLVPVAAPPVPVPGLVGVAIGSVLVAVVSAAAAAGVVLVGAGLSSALLVGSGLGSGSCSGRSSSLAPVAPALALVVPAEAADEISGGSSPEFLAANAASGPGPGPGPAPAPGLDLLEASRSLSPDTSAAAAATAPVAMAAAGRGGCGCCCGGPATRPAVLLLVVAGPAAAAAAKVEAGWTTTGNVALVTIPRPCPLEVEADPGTLVGLLVLEVRGLPPAVLLLLVVAVPSPPPTGAAVLPVLVLVANGTYGWLFG